MKRLIAVVLSAMLVLGAIPALAQTNTIDTRFFGQAREVGVKGTLSFTTSGVQTALMEPSVWLLLRTQLPRVQVEFSHSRMRGTGEGQAAAKLLLDGQDAGESRFLYSDSLMALSSDLLAGRDTYYTAAAGWDISELLFALDQQSQWPPLWRMLMAIQHAPEEWKERAQNYLVPYETKLGLWMNGYAEFSSENRNGVDYTRLSYRIPARGMKAEIKQLMVDFYADQELLSLLREIVSPEEAAAYLQPAMQNNFFTMLDALNLEGQVEINRENSVNGSRDEISLPFAETQPLNKLTVVSEIIMTEQGAAPRFAYQGQTKSGLDFAIAYEPAANNVFSGSVQLLLPVPKLAEGSFEVSESVPERKNISFDFTVNWEVGKEEYFFSADRLERKMKATMVIRPIQGSGIPAQSLMLDLLISGPSDERVSTRAEGTLTWRDLDNDAALTARMQANTTARFPIEQVNSLKGAMRLDLMDLETRGSLMARWSENLSLWFQRLSAQLLPAMPAQNP